MSKYSCNENGLFLEDEMYLTDDDVLKILNSQENKITELETKLAEKERQYETLYKLFSEQHEIIDQDELGCFEEVNRLLKEQKDFYIVEKTEYDKMKQGAKDIVKQLKHQLEEKKKKIKQLKLNLGMFKSVNEFINNYGIDKAREVLLQTEKTKHQDKIEFAVEQLEKMKERLIQNADEIGEEYKEDYFMISLGNVKNIIDNQIKQLKDGK